MKLSLNDEYIVRKIEGADNREEELFAMIMEFGLDPSQVIEIERELMEKGINIMAHEQVKNPNTGDSTWMKSTLAAMQME